LTGGIVSHKKIIYTLLSISFNLIWPPNNSHHFLTSGIASHHFFSWLVSLSHQSFHRKILIPRKATSPVSGRQELKIHISLQKARPSELGELASRNPCHGDSFRLKFSSPSGRHGGCPLCKVRTIWSSSLIPFVLNDILLPLEP